MNEALKLGQLSGCGTFTARCAAYLEKSTGAQKAILTGSGTAALEMMGLLLDLQPGDEVIVPAFTFVSTANAFLLRGAKPVFVDVRPDTLNIDEKQIEKRISKKTKAVCVVHYAGVACEMDPILKLGIPVLEDNAHGLLGQYRGRPLGSFGTLAAQSFHDTKNLTCGEGGALLINDPQYLERAEVLRDKGTNRKKFMEKIVDKYTWVDVGSSFGLSDLAAAFLWAQFERAKDVQKKRAAAWNLYDRLLEPVAESLGLRRPTVPSHCEQSFHMYYVLCRSKQHRSELIQFLKARDIHAVFHYHALNASPMAQRMGFARQDCPVTEQVSDQVLRLPFFTDISTEEIHRVVNAIQEFRS